MAKYISDNSGKHTAVLIPINEWDEITAKHADLKELMGDDISVSKNRKPSDFAGTLSKEDGEKFLAYIEQSRSEWERSF